MSERDPNKWPHANTIAVFGIAGLILVCVCIAVMWKAYCS